MANATETHANGVCNITLPANTTKIAIHPKTSGNAQYINYCEWRNSSNPMATFELGKWSAHQQDITVLSNPFNFIHANSDDAIVNTSSTPPIGNIGKMSLGFTHQNNANSPIVESLLNVSVTNATDDITIITILAEDTGDQNYLDFQMVVIVYDN